MNIQRYQPHFDPFASDRKYDEIIVFFRSEKHVFVCTIFTAGYCQCPFDSDDESFGSCGTCLARHFAKRSMDVHLG